MWLWLAQGIRLGIMMKLQTGAMRSHLSAHSLVSGLYLLSASPSHPLPMSVRPLAFDSATPPLTFASDMAKLAQRVRALGAKDSRHWSATLGQICDLHASSNPLCALWLLVLRAQLRSHGHPIGSDHHARVAATDFQVMCTRVPTDGWHAHDATPLACIMRKAVPWLIVHANTAGWGIVGNRVAAQALTIMLNEARLPPSLSRATAYRFPLAQNHIVRRCYSGVWNTLREVARAAVGGSRMLKMPQRLREYAAIANLPLDHTTAT